jgi:hypothetical protein
MAHLSGQPALHSLQLPIQLLLLICQSSSFHPIFIFVHSLQFSIQLLCSSVNHLFHPFAAVVLHMEMSVFKSFFQRSNTYDLLIWHSYSFHPSAAVSFSQITSLQFFSAFQQNCFAPLALFLFPSSCGNVFFLTDGIFVGQKVFAVLGLNCFAHLSSLYVSK